MIWIIATAVVIGAGALLWAVTPTERDRELARLAKSWQARFGHLPFEDRHKLHVMLMRFVRLRRKASAAVLKQPGNSAEIVEKLAIEEAEVDPETAAQFLKIVAECDISEILYPDALKAAYVVSVIENRDLARAVEFDGDAIAAMRIF